MISFQDLSIKRKVMTVIMLASMTVLLLNLAAFIAYDLVSWHQMMVRNLSATAATLAARSADALATRNVREGQEILSALRANPNIAAAALYDGHGDILVRQPAQDSIGTFPLLPGTPGVRIEQGRLMFFAPVQQDGQLLGTLYLKSTVRPLLRRLEFYGGLGLAVLCASALASALIAGILQRHITQPILALVEKAKVVATRRDYSVRADVSGRDELAWLAEAFNQMLLRIEEQAAAARRDEEFRSFLVATVESSDDAIIGKDLHSTIVSWNTGAERLFGYTAAEMLGQPITRLQAPDHPREEAEIVQAILEGKVCKHETVRIRKDGRRVDISLTASPIRNARGEIIGISSISRDITQRKQVERQVRQVNAELEQRVLERTAELTAANKELEAFTYSVAHDLRAPLRHMDAFARIVMEDYAEALPAGARQYLESIAAGSRNMSALVDDLLNLAHVGRQALKREPVSLDAPLNKVVAELKREIKDRVIEWRLQPLPVVECDSGLIKQVFANLLSNAVKYTRPREIAIIEAGCLQRDGETFVFIRDNGVGFNMKYIAKLFGVFQRLHRAEEFEGTGVGLAIVDRIVRKHGGRVWAEGAVGKGATFYFSLPGMLLPPPVKPEALPQPTEPASAERQVTTLAA